MSGYVQYDSTRPKQEFERAMCRDATWMLLVRNPPGGALAGCIASVFRPADSRYLAARRAQLGAVARVRAARRRVDAELVRFGVAFRDWKDTVKDEASRVRTRELTWLLSGVLPSRFTRLDPREQLSRAEALFEMLEESPALRGDAGKLDAWKRVYSDLSAATLALDVAHSDVRTALPRLAEASRTFDCAWGIVVRTAMETLGREAALVWLPSFRRRRRARGAAARGDGTDAVSSAGEPGAEPDADEGLQLDCALTLASIDPNTPVDTATW